MNWFRTLVPNPERQTMDGEIFEFGQYNGGWYGLVQQYPGTLAFGKTREDLFQTLKSSVSYIKGEEQPVEVVYKVKLKKVKRIKLPKIKLELLTKFEFDTEEIAKAYFTSYIVGENQRSELKGKKVLIYKNN